MSVALRGDRKKFLSSFVPPYVYRPDLIATAALRTREKNGVTWMRREKILCSDLTCSSSLFAHHNKAYGAPGRSCSRTHLAVLDPVCVCVCLVLTQSPKRVKSEQLCSGTPAPKPSQD